MAKRVEVIDVSKVKNKELLSSDVNGNLIQTNPINPDKLPLLEFERDQMVVEVPGSKSNRRKPAVIVEEQANN